MQNVTINSKKCGINHEAKISLTNGSLVIHRNRLGDVLGAYLVTSFRYNRGVTTERAKEATQSYCSLINLDTGYIAFDERASRNTTIKRVLSHLNKGDYYAQQALIDNPEKLREIQSPIEIETTKKKLKKVEDNKDDSTL